MYKMSSWASGVQPAPALTLTPTHSANDPKTRLKMVPVASVPVGLPVAITPLTRIILSTRVAGVKKSAASRRVGDDPRHRTEARGGGNKIHDSTFTHRKHDREDTRARDMQRAPPCVHHAHVMHTLSTRDRKDKSAGNRAPRPRLESPIRTLALGIMRAHAQQGIGTCCKNFLRASG